MQLESIFIYGAHVRPDQVYSSLQWLLARRNKIPTTTSKLSLLTCPVIDAKWMGLGHEQKFWILRWLRSRSISCKPFFLKGFIGLCIYSHMGDKGERPMITYQNHQQQSVCLEEVLLVYMSQDHYLPRLFQL